MQIETGMWVMISKLDYVYTSTELSLPSIQ